MAKFHIKQDGTPGECQATLRDCPLGGEAHFNSVMDAQGAADDRHEVMYGFGGFGFFGTPDPAQTKEKIAKLVVKEHDSVNLDDSYTKLAGAHSRLSSQCAEHASKQRELAELRSELVVPDMNTLHNQSDMLRLQLTLAAKNQSQDTIDNGTYYEPLERVYMKTQEKELMVRQEALMQAEVSGGEREIREARLKLNEYRYEHERTYERLKPVFEVSEKTRELHREGERIKRELEWELEDFTDGLSETNRDRANNRILVMKDSLNHHQFDSFSAQLKNENWVHVY